MPSETTDIEDVIPASKDQPAVKDNLESRRSLTSTKKKVNLQWIFNVTTTQFREITKVIKIVKPVNTVELIE